MMLRFDKIPNCFKSKETDIALFALQDIKMVLLQPNLSGNTKRKQGVYHFDIDFSNINLC